MDFMLGGKVNLESRERSQGILPHFWLLLHFRGSQVLCTPLYSPPIYILHYNTALCFHTVAAAIASWVVLYSASSRFLYFRASADTFL